MSNERDNHTGTENSEVSSVGEIQDDCPNVREVAEKVDKRGEVSFMEIAIMMTWKRRCQHAETVVHYREDVAGGDFIVWKEICNRCSTIVKSGTGRYVETPVKGRTVTISPATKYDDGWVWNQELLKKIQWG